MATVKHTVVWGDTLSELAVYYAKKLSRAITVKSLVELNDITDPDFIVVGQVLVIHTDDPVTKKKNTTSKAVVKAFGIQTNTNNTMYATWSWDKDHTKEYQIVWYYATGDGVWFIGNESTTTHKQCTYSAPSNAKKVKFKVKPVSTTYKVGKKEVNYWTAGWSTEKQYQFSDNPPVKPTGLKANIEGLKLTAEISGLEAGVSIVQFVVWKDDATKYNSAKVNVTATATAAFTCSVTAGSKYKVYCRSYKKGSYSEWSDYTANMMTAPATPSGFKKCEFINDTEVKLEWSAINTAEEYTVEYTDNHSYFNEVTDLPKLTTKETSMIIRELNAETTYFFRLKSKNSAGESGWSEVGSTISGVPPSAPTTWSSTTTAMLGESVNLYWVHNSNSGASQESARISLEVNGKELNWITVPNSTEESEKDRTSVYELMFTGNKLKVGDVEIDITEGAIINWRVRTAEASGSLGEWSVSRTIRVYAEPNFEIFDLLDSSGEAFEELKSFPFTLTALPGPSSQNPIGYQLTITSNIPYETVDNLGNIKMVGAGEQVYSKYFDNPDYQRLEHIFAPGEMTLENNVEYTLTCTAHMDSGLLAIQSVEFKVAWDDALVYEPNAEIGIDEENLTAIIKPYCEDAEGQPIENVILSVYRREFDGRFTELITGIDSLNTKVITDPHPALDYARYRIVATDKITGNVSYCDLPGYPVGGTAVIMQWDEKWTSFDSLNADEMEEPNWSGSMLKLPYNVDVSDSYKPDVELVKYIGREHSVSYYGTHTGESSTWSVSIEADDEETLYALRRLARWMGDVYVREPSGSGYWANVTVSFSRKHCDVVIPVTFNITRVEGGI